MSINCRGPGQITEMLTTVHYSEWNRTRNTPYTYNEGEPNNELQLRTTKNIPDRFYKLFISRKKPVRKNHICI